MADMTSRVKKGGVYSFRFTAGQPIEGTAQAHGINGSPIHLRVEGIIGPVYVNPDHVVVMIVVNEDAAKGRDFDY